MKITFDGTLEEIREIVLNGLIGSLYKTVHQFACQAAASAARADTSAHNSEMVWNDIKKEKKTNQD